MIGRRRIFVSHSIKDNELARIIVDALRGYGFDIWYDEYNLGFGPIRQELEKALSKCQVFIVLLSLNALQSLWVNREINAALALEANQDGMLIVPARVGPCPIPPLLSGYRRLDFTTGDPVAELRQFAYIVDEGRASQPPPPVPSAPEQPTTSHSPQPTYSIGSIKGRNVNVNMAENVSITQSYEASPSSMIKHDLSRFTVLVEELKRLADSHATVDIHHLELFLELMAKIRAEDLSPKFVEKVRTLCKQLEVMPLI